MAVCASLTMVSCTSIPTSQDSASLNQRPPQNGQRQGQGQTPPSVDQLFEQMDTNKDGKLSKEEVKGPLANDFSKIDTNGDKFISREEMEKAPKPERRGRN